MAFKSSAGTVPYQPAPSIQPKYGFRYSGSPFAPATNPANMPPVNYSIPSYEEPPEATPYIGTPPVMQSDNNDSVGIRPQSANNNAINTVTNTPQYSGQTDPMGNPTTMGMTQAQIENPVANPVDFYGNPIAPEVYSPVPDPSMMIPGGSIMSLNQPAIPTSGYGTPGTYSGLTGGQFNQSSQAVDPITGQPIAEFGTTGAFMESLLDDPLANTTSPQGKLSDMEYAGQTSQLASLGAGTTDPMGNPATTGLDKGAEDKVATQLGLDMGFEPHTVAPGTPTHTSIKTGVYTPGSSFIPGGKITGGTGTPNNLSIEDDVVGIETDKGLDTSGIDVSGIDTGVGASGDLGGAVGAGYTNTDPNNNVGGYESAGVQSGSQTSHSGTGTSFADDAASSDSGGGGK